jgi:hypothetical protein
MLNKIKKYFQKIIKKEEYIEKGNIVRVYGTIKKSEQKTYDYFFSYVNCIEETEICDVKNYSLKNLKKWNSIKWAAQYSSFEKDICSYEKYTKSDKGKNTKILYEPASIWKKIYVCDEVEKENFIEFFKEKIVYPRDNIFILIDKIRLGFRFEMIKDPDGYTDTSYLSFQFPCSFYYLLIDGKKVWFHEDNIEKIG